jgi:hypothetical protein
MKVKELIQLIQAYPELEVVSSVPDDYDQEGEISNYTDPRVIRLDSAIIADGLLYLLFEDDKLYPEEVI